MKLSNLIMIHAVICIALGIAFSLYAPLMMAFFAIPDVLDSPLSYWQVAAFARMFGVAQFGLGLLLLSLRGFVDIIPSAARQGILSALMLANLIGAFAAITQQQAVWQTPAGWITTFIYVAFFLAYVYFLAKPPKRRENLGSS